MGLAGESGEVLAGDPIPAAPGQANAAGNFFDGEGNTAIVGETDNLWDGLIVEPETIFIQEEAEEVEPTGPTGPTTEVQFAAEVEAEEIVVPGAETTSTVAQPVEQTSQDSPIVEEEKNSSDPIIVTTTVEVFEYETVSTDDSIETTEEASTDNMTMIIVVASIIAVLLVVIGVMVARVALKKRSVEKLSEE